MNSFIKYVVIVCAILASLIALPFLLKGVIITFATLVIALALAGVFLLGIIVAAALLSPLWIPFLAGWIAVVCCKKYYKKSEATTPDKTKPKSCCG